MRIRFLYSGAEHGRGHSALHPIPPMLPAFSFSSGRSPFYRPPAFPSPLYTHAKRWHNDLGAHFWRIETPCYPLDRTRIKRHGNPVPSTSPRINPERIRLFLAPKRAKTEAPPRAAHPSSPAQPIRNSARRLLSWRAQATATPTATKAIATSTISIADINSAQQTQSSTNQNRDQSYPATRTDHPLPCRQISLRAADAKTLALPAGADCCYDIA